MWRSAFIIVLLAGSPALSPAFAGQASATFQVGITITGNPAQTPTKAKVPGSSAHAAAGVTSAAKAAALKRPRPRRPQ